MTTDLTQLLLRWRDGDPHALGALFPMIQGELRRIARGALRSERVGMTLQPTELVNEAFLRLVPQQQKDWQNRQHFFAVCAQLMRQVLVDQARRRNALKRGAGELQVELNEDRAASSEDEPGAAELLDLDHVLTELARVDARRTRIVEMRYFAGMTIPEIASALGVSEWEVKKDWTIAKAWLRRRLRSSA